MNFEIVSDERTPIERKLRIRIDPASVEKVWAEEVARLAPETSVPGFRQGKAPHNLVERSVGREPIWANVREIAAGRALNSLLKDADPAPLAPPNTDFEDGEEEEPAWEPGQALEFTATYLLPPPTPEEIERDLMRGAGVEEPEVPGPQIEAPKPPSTTPPDPRSQIPGSGVQMDDEK